MGQAGFHTKVRTWVEGFREWGAEGTA